VDCCFSELAL